MEAGRYFLHEHPFTAESWGEKVMKEFAVTEGVYFVKGPCVDGT